MQCIARIVTWVLSRIADLLQAAGTYVDWQWDGYFGGWNEQPQPNDCRQHPTVVNGTESNVGDWKTLNSSVEWIRTSGKAANEQGQSFFAYQGMNIVHPPVRGARQFYDQIDPDGEIDDY